MNSYFQVKSFVSTLVLHMDDNNPQIQVRICAVIKIKFHLSSILLIVISVKIFDVRSWFMRHYKYALP